MKEDIFDSLIREKLENAEVRAPKGVWAAVSRRMGVAKPRRLWPVYALAGACAAVAAFFLIQRSVESSPAFDRVVLEAQPSLLTLADMPQPDGLIDLRVREMARPEEEVEIEAVKEDSAPEVQIDTPESKDVEVYAEDPFAAMMAEDARLESSREPVSIRFGGVVGANDSHFGSATRRPAWASGYLSEGVTQNSVSSYMIPVSVGISARFPINDKFSVGAGLTWTMLNRRFQGSYNTAEGEITHRVDYVGIPVEVYYNLIQRSSLQIYAYLGGSVEKAVGSRYYLYSQSDHPLISEKVEGVQFGLRMGFGVSFSLTKLISLYFDPYLGYYIPGNEPMSLRTEHPLMVSFDAGLRFNL